MQVRSAVYDPIRDHPRFKQVLQKLGLDTRTAPPATTAPQH